MPTRTKQALIGDQGEFLTAAMLLATGASINSLTSSDYGWDLHLQLPEVPLAAMDEEFAKTDKWELSNRIVHVQVKGMSSNRFPTIALGAARSWVNGSYAIAPTFVVIRKRDGTFLMSSPADIREWLRSYSQDTNKARRSLSTCPRRPVDERNMTAVLDLWSLYPAVMMAVESDVVDELMSGSPDKVLAAAKRLVVSLATAHMATYHPDRVDTESGEPFADAVESLLTAIEGNISDEELDHDAHHETVKMEIMSTMISESQLRGRWLPPGLELPTAFYTSSNDPSEGLYDAEKLLQRITLLTKRIAP